MSQVPSHLSIPINKSYFSKRQELPAAEIVAYLKYSGLNSNSSVCKALPGRPERQGAEKDLVKDLLTKQTVIPHCVTFLMAATRQEACERGEEALSWFPGLGCLQEQASGHMASEFRKQIANRKCPP